PPLNMGGPVGAGPQGVNPFGVAPAPGGNEPPDFSAMPPPQIPAPGEQPTAQAPPMPGAPITQQIEITDDIANALFIDRIKGQLVDMLLHDVDGGDAAD